MDEAESRSLLRAAVAARNAAAGLAIFGGLISLFVLNTLAPEMGEAFAEALGGAQLPGLTRFVIHAPGARVLAFVFFAAPIVILCVRKIGLVRQVYSLSVLGILSCLFSLIIVMALLLPAITIFAVMG